MSRPTCFYNHQHDVGLSLSGRPKLEFRNTLVNMWLHAKHADFLCSETIGLELSRDTWSTFEPFHRICSCVS